MRIIRYYLLKEIFPPFFLALLVSTVILTAGNVIQMADMIINKGVSALLMLQLVGLLMPSLLMFTLPISVLSAVLLGFARLTSDNEIIAIRASGVNLFKLASPVFLVGVIISLACIPLNYKIMPESGYMARKLVKEIGVRNPTALLEPGVFLKIFREYIIFIYDIRGDQLRNIRIYQPQQNGPTRTLIAEKGQIMPQPRENTIKIKLSNGIADETSPDKPDTFYKLIFDSYYITLDLKDSLQQHKIDKKAREYTLAELRREINKFKEKNIDITPLLIEKYNKLALSFSNLIFILIAIPIGVKTHRREKSINFGMALVVFLIYWTLMLGGVACTIRKLIPPWLGVWSPNIIFGLVSIFLYIRVMKR